jgi:predicted phosphodiesterase
MKRLSLGVLAGSVVLVAVALSSHRKPAASNELQIQIEERNPWSHLRLNHGPEIFHFAVVSDRTGGHRARIFSQAVEQLNLLQPAFVISVGDLIEGYTKEKARLQAQWKEFQSYVCKLQMPFFYVTGNHDVSNKFQERQWQDRFGRRFYHFVYRDVLFLMLCSDDPAPAENGGKISKEQIEFVRQVLKENGDVRWTIVALHRPLWSQADLSTNGWLEVEKALQGRTYTVFAGHVHRYQKFVRHGMNYYQLATTGGGSRLRGVPYGEFDHIVWVTMKKDGPVLANLMLDGILPENLKPVVTAEEGVDITNRKTVYPVRGKVYFDGTPAAMARVVFHLVIDKKTSWTADGMVEADGTFQLSTYRAFDGAPAGEYIATVVWRDPWADAQGRPGPNRLPEKYASPATSGLRVQVRPGQNDFTLNLTR